MYKCATLIQNVPHQVTGILSETVQVSMQYSYDIMAILASIRLGHSAPDARIAEGSRSRQAKCWPQQRPTGLFRIPQDRSLYLSAFGGKTTVTLCKGKTSRQIRLVALAVPSVLRKQSIGDYCHSLGLVDILLKTLATGPGNAGLGEARRMLSNGRM